MATGCFTSVKRLALEMGFGLLGLPQTQACLSQSLFQNLCPGSPWSPDSVAERRKTMKQPREKDIMCLNTAKRQTIFHRGCCCVSRPIKGSIIKAIRMFIHGKDKRTLCPKSLSNDSSIMVLTEPHQLNSVR